MRKGQLLEAILEQKEAVHKDGWNVVTSQRRDVGSTNFKVNKWQHRDASTSRRLSFATPQRRDVLMSRRQREFYLLSLKAKRGAEFEASGIGDQGTYELGHGNQNSSDVNLEEEPMICIFLRFG